MLLCFGLTVQSVESYMICLCLSECVDNGTVQVSVARGSCGRRCTVYLALVTCWNRHTCRLH